MDTYELVGYAGSAIIIAASMMTSILRLRLLGMVGASTFAIYGLLIQAYPVAATNIFIVMVHGYHLTRMMRTREYFTIVNVVPDSDYLKFFLEHNRADIKKFFPDFEYHPVPNQVTLFVVRDLLPTGLLIGEQRPDGTLFVHLDYVIPGYRDLKIGQYLLEDRADYFRALGIHSVHTRGATRLHANYLAKMGFEPLGNELFARSVG